MRPNGFVGAIAGFLLAFGVVAPSEAQTSARITPSQLAAAIEQRAGQSNFASLEAFGEQATHLSGHERLARLNHVATILLDQSEFDRFRKWNSLLAKYAAQDNDHRFQMVARVNELNERINNGEQSVEKELVQIYQTDPDWFVRVHAMHYEAYSLQGENEAGEALKLMSDAGGLVPNGDPDTRMAKSEIWQAVGLALMSLYDMGGMADALGKSEIEYSDPAYPRPDFDAVYNMARIAVQLGDEKLARRMAEVHHRLAVRAGLPHLTIWDKALCASVGEAFGKPDETLGCLQGLAPGLADAEFLAPSLLSTRAIALARLHRVDEAEADLNRFRQLKASGQFDQASFSREPLINAEILVARGKSAEAVEAMRGYMKESASANARRFNGGVHQITSQLRGQLGAAQRNAELNRRIIYFQWGIGLLGVFMLVGGVFVVHRQRKLAGQFRDAQLRADAANRAKSDFLANISHEIRTPLNGVLGMAQAIAADELTPRQRSRLEVVSQSGKALLAILNDLLDLSKIEAGRLELEQIDFDLGVLANGVRAAFEPLTQQKGLYLNIEFGPDTAGVYRGDPTRVRQILDNLVSNAIKFTQTGGVTIQITRPAEVVCFVVIDTGIGMSTEVASRIFSKFEQADISTTRRFGGTGLGLSICKELSAAMGGDISLWSAPGQGAAFTVTLPLTQIHSGDNGLVEPDNASASIGDGRRIRILAAEDNPTNQLVVRTLLSQAGCDLTIVGDGRSAVHAFETGEFDVVLMDIQMPEMDGVEATRRMRLFEQAIQRRRTPVVALTANAMAHQVGEYLSAGFDGHVAKPIEASVLFAAITAAMARGEDAMVDAEATIENA